MINNLPTIYEVVTGANKKQTKEKATTNGNSKNSKSNSKISRNSESQVKPSKMSLPKDEEESGEEDVEEDAEEHGNTLCGACGDNYANDEFWICCDLCEKWFHGKCVRITPARAEHIKQYKCPSCSGNKRAKV